MEEVLRKSQILKENTIEYLYMNGREDLVDYIPTEINTKNNNEIEEITCILAKSGRPVEIQYINSFISK